MAIATYADLQQAIGAWLHRDDLAARIPDFIALAEARIARDVRMQRQIKTQTLSTQAGVPTVALPADWLEGVRLTTDSPHRVLEHVPGGVLAQAYPAAYSGPMRWFVVEGDTLTIWPTPADVLQIECVYYARIPALDATPTNWLLQQHPGLYLFGALAEAAPFLQDDTRAPLWEGKYSADVAQATAADARAVSSGSQLRMRAR